MAPVTRKPGDLEPYQPSRGKRKAEDLGEILGKRVQTRSTTRQPESAKPPEPRKRSNLHRLPIELQAKHRGYLQNLCYQHSPEYLATLAEHLMELIKPARLMGTQQTHARYMKILQKHGGMQPRRKASLDGLPEHIQRKIFELLLVRQDYICPFYKETYRPRTPEFDISEMAVLQNGVPPIWFNRRYNISSDLFLVSAISKVCLEVFYSKNVFVFNDARSCRYFFDERPQKLISLMRKVVFNMSSGFYLSAANRGDREVCEERRWCMLLHDLRSKHQFSKLCIRFVGWNGLEDRTDLSELDKAAMTLARRNMVAHLGAIQGLEKVWIANEECEFLGLFERNEIAAAMVCPAEPEYAGMLQGQGYERMFDRVDAAPDGPVPRERPEGENVHSKIDKPLWEQIKLRGIKSRLAWPTVVARVASRPNDPDARRHTLLHTLLDRQR